MTKEPAPKKAKSGDAVVLEDLADKAWQHYQNYLESCEEGNEEGDSDELTEVILLLEPHIKKNKSVKIKDLRTKTALLPVLCSVASYFLADQAIAIFLQEKEWSDEIRQHLGLAIDSFPLNAAALSMGSNFARMTKRLQSAQIITWYEQAAEYAVLVRSGAMLLLEDDTVDDSVKEWIELLLLNQIAGVELDGDEDDEEDEGEWSASTVESTSRFMAAMLLSTAGDHDRALNHLKEFPLTHRLHPNVWLGKADKVEYKNSSPRISSVSCDAVEPVSFRRPDGLLPVDLYQRLLNVFKPNTAYWKESDYDKRGYYSYFMDLPPHGQAPSNALEEVMVHHLLPLAAEQLGKQTASTICGFEWWVHTRPIEANLGHNLHFDTDESLLAQEGKITHPILSSVLYLTGGTSGGATIVLDQTPDSELDAEQCWRSVPVDNSFLVFPGELLHGVLPCPGKNPTAAAAAKGSKPLVAAVADLWKKPPAAAETQNRLTLMVGFWTRRVPDKMKEQRLYGPCGPMPPCTEEHTWVQELSKGYKGGKAKASEIATAGVSKSLQVVPIPRVTPTWEQFHSNAALDDLPLMIPRAIDHRFFVHSGSMCFRESLFERDEFDQEDDSEEEDEES